MTVERTIRVATVVDDINQAFAFIAEPRIVISPVWWEDDVCDVLRFECSIEGSQG